MTVYCNEACQRADWPSHKATCKELLQLEKQRKQEIGNRLFRDCADGNALSVSLHVMRGANVNFVVVDGPSKGSFPLLVAAKNGPVDVIRCLIKSGAESSKVGTENLNDGMESATSLGAAAYNGHERAVREILAAGADPNQSFGDLRNSAIYFAARNGHVGALNALIESGGDVNHFRCLGDSPLHPAACNSHVEAVKVLIAAGADVHHKDQYTQGTIIHLSIGYAAGQTESKVLAIVEALLAAGVDTNAKDYFGQTALDRAVAHNFSTVSSLLRRYA